MKKLDQYILREMMVPLIIGTLAVVLMFQANLLIGIYKEYNLERVPAAAILQFIFLKTPSFLQMTLPVGMALASAMAVSRLARESELVAMRMAGTRLIRILAMVSLLGLLVSGISLWVSEGVMPEAEKRSRKLLTELAVLAQAPPMKSDIMLRLKQYSVQIRTARREGDAMVLTDILLIQEQGPNTWIVYTSPEGRYEDGLWTMEKPVMMRISGGTLVSFEAPKSPLIINEKFSIPDFFVAPMAEEKSLAELQTGINEAKRQGRDSSSLEIAYHTKLSTAFTCFAFSLTGPAMAILLMKRGPFVGVLLSLAIVLGYYNLFIISTQIFGRNGWLPPIAAAWMPTAVVGLLGLSLVWRSE